LRDVFTERIVSFADTCPPQGPMQAGTGTRSDAPSTAGRRADELRPPGRRTGEGVDSLLPYLAVTLASKPKPGPPGGVERRARPRDG